MGEVEERLERQLPGEYPALAGRQPRRRNAAVGLQQAADLGRQREAVAGIAPENVADAVLAEPVAVERRRIEVPDAGLVRRDHGIERRLLVERRIEVPKDVAAASEDGDHEPGPAERTSMSGTSQGEDPHQQRYPAAARTQTP